MTRMALSMALIRCGLVRSRIILVSLVPYSPQPIPFRGRRWPRFVNGLVDVQQKGVYAQSVATVAESLGLPHSFVDLRHEATHGALPSLPLLRLTAEQVCAHLRANLRTPASPKHATGDAYPCAPVHRPSPG